MLSDRPVREDLVDARWKKGREKENSNTPEDPEPPFRRDVSLLGSVRTNPPDEPRGIRHGLRPDW